MPNAKPSRAVKATAGMLSGDKVKFEIYGEEMIEKRVSPSGTCGRVYLPANWENRRVKIIRVD